MPKSNKSEEKKILYEEVLRQFEESKKTLDQLKKAMEEDSDETVATVDACDSQVTCEDSPESVQPVPGGDDHQSTAVAKPWVCNEGEGLNADFELSANFSINEVIKYIETNKLSEDAVVSKHISTFQITDVPTGLAPVDQLMPPTPEPREVEKYILVEDPSILFIRDVITQPEVMALAHLASDKWAVYEGVPARRSVGGSGYIRIAQFKEENAFIERIMKRIAQLGKVDEKLVPRLELRELRQGCFLPCGFEPTSVTAYIFFKNPSEGGKVVFPCANLTLSPELGSCVMWTNSADGANFDVRVLNQTTPVADRECNQLIAVIQWLNPDLPQEGEVVNEKIDTQ
eukprot:GHVH01002109.1.p1 GENE.GHVH01002109.1~~GHVH01002109.1.p1  ORF type:complete len:362 (+),score=67.15 GHVH01002109.1:58-1086(+)